jgi:hypothetical protein
MGNTLSMSYTPAQELIFFNTPQKFVVVSKGRRVGLTRGGAQAFIEKCLKKEIRVLWGETIYSNVQRYVDLYFIPYLNKLPKGSWNWSAKMMQLKIRDSIIDFRSADNPETWEGFGYHIIFLNEAGIILRDANLYKKTVLPMLMDYADSQLIAAGVPKGKRIKSGELHPFYELSQKALHEPGKYKHYKFPSYSNPFLSPEDIDEIAGALDDQTRKQEIEGEFVDTSDSPYMYAFAEDKHVIGNYEINPHLDLLVSFDFNKEPMTCLVSQQPQVNKLVIFDEIRVSPGSTPEICEALLAKYPKFHGRMEVTGDATGRNRSSLVRGNVNHYIIIADMLQLNSRQLLVPRQNPSHQNSRILCNSVLQNAEFYIHSRCRETINDCIYAEVDSRGELVKTQQEGRHFFDNVRYLIESGFKDFITKPHKYAG